ncbi:MAG: cellulase family glycosylhydrolase [Ignavibacteriales bacterium]|nr:cellulase family glycosylhydrolase [Ignavibacteriales bacterium]
MSKLTMVLFLVVLFFSSSLPQSNSTQFVSVNGKEIISPDGKPLLLKGINLGNWLVPEGYMFKFEKTSSWRLIHQVIAELIGPDEANTFWNKYHENYITHEDIKFIKSIGLNSVRIPFDFRLFTPEEQPDVWIETGFKLLDKVIGWCKKENIYVVLDMHCAPGGQTGDNIDNSWGYPWLFVSKKSQQRTIEIWKRISERYKDETILVGYDFFNEPIATYFEADRATLNAQLEPLYKEITSTVRAVDKNHLIFPGGAQWNTNFKIFGAPFDSKLVYNFHKYWCDTTQDQIQEYVDYGNKYSVPLWMSESGENTNEWIGAWRRLMEKNNISWCFWPYKKMDATSCLVQFNRPEGYQKVIDYAEVPRNSFEDIRKLRPNVEEVKKALEGFLENCQFKNCTPNKGYIKALGLNIAD